MNDKIIREDIDKIWNEFNLEEIAGKSILLTGGTGLIGTYIIYSILKLNKEKVAQTKIRLVIHNELPLHLHMLYENNAVELYKGDLSDYNFCMSLPDSEFIIHAAGYAQPGRFMESKVKTIRINTMATDILLGKLKENGKFLFISTSEIYSGSNENPYKETTFGTSMPDHSRACYIEGKRCGESICHAYIAMGKTVKIARVSLAYGPGIRGDDKRVLYNFIQNGVNGAINMMDSGKAKRVYCYVADTVSILWNILLNGETVIYNVGGNSHTTIFELANLVGENLNASVSVLANQVEIQGAPPDVFVDMSKVEKEFKKTDYLTLKEGISRTVDWYKENIL